MGRGWLSDAGQPDDGGDGMLDIYLVRDANLTYRGLTSTYDGCEESPAWIVLTSDKPLGDATTPGLLQTAAHEMLHAVQFSYPLHDACASYAWLQEATAKWFEHTAYPDAQSEHEYAPVYLSDTHHSLEAGPLSRHYSAYLYPFFLTETLGTGEPVRRMWENAATMDSLSAVDQSGASFADHWKDFALVNWNQGPESRYQSWDDLTATVQQEHPDHTVAGVTRIWEYILPSHLEHLSIQYERYRFTDETARTVVFYNGLAHELAHDDAQTIPQGDDSVTYYSKGALPADDVAALSVQALIKFEDNPVWVLQDWTAREFVAFCRDQRAERIEELVLILANAAHDPTDPNYDFTARGVQPTLLISPVGCWRWQGWAEMSVAPQEVGTKDSDIYEDVRASNLVWERKSWYSGGWGAQYGLVSGTTGTWTYHEVFRSSGCSADLTLDPLDLSADECAAASVLQTFFGVTSGHLKNGYSSRGLTCPDSTTAVYECPGYPPSELGIIRLSDWLQTDRSAVIGYAIPITPMQTVVNGTLMEGSYAWPELWYNDQATYTWRFEAQREP